MGPFIKVVSFYFTSSWLKLSLLSPNFLPFSKLDVIKAGDVTS